MFTDTCTLFTATGIIYWYLLQSLVLYSFKVPAPEHNYPWVCFSGACGGGLMHRCFVEFSPGAMENSVFIPTVLFSLGTLEQGTSTRAIWLFKVLLLACFIIEYIVGIQKLSLAVFMGHPVAVHALLHRRPNQWIEGSWLIMIYEPIIPFTSVSVGENVQEVEGH